MNSKKGLLKIIWVVAFCLALFVALIVLLVKEPEIESVSEPSSVILGDASNINYQIIVYYFPKKKAEAQALTYFFKEHGYNVAMQSAATEPGLKGSQYSPSHIFFN